MQVISNMRTINFLWLLFIAVNGYSQPAKEKITTAFAAFEKDEQFRHASIGFYLVNSKTGAVVFDKNSQVGLAPASTQKVVTAVSAYEMLGKNFQYRSELGYEGKIENGAINGMLIFKGSGDPTLGSWRWKQTSAEETGKNITGALKSAGIKTINGDLLIDETAWESQATPDGWTWDDIGNYYGAGASAVNWHENKYDLWLKPGTNIGDRVEVIKTIPAMPLIPILNELKTAKAGSGDNSIIYFPENGGLMAIRGTIPAGVNQFKVSGSFPNSPLQLGIALQTLLNESGIQHNGAQRSGLQYLIKDQKPAYAFKQIIQFNSPPLDSMSMWFLRESINLYGEAFVKTIAYQKNGFGAEKPGLDIIKNFWSSKGIDKGALNIKDGSGLSPANRLTPHALVTILQYAQKQPWYESFENALPVQNGFKMKSGYIGGVRSYAGYIKSKTGEEYTFAFIINNFDGSPGAVREKMWKLLDLMK